MKQSNKSLADLWRPDPTYLEALNEQDLFQFQMRMWIKLFNGQSNEKPIFLNTMLPEVWWAKRRLLYRKKSLALCYHLLGHEKKLAQLHKEIARLEAQL